MNKDVFLSAILGLVTGDALGSLFEGLSRPHIRAMVRDIDGYIDPSPLLKGKMERWTKPGLYTSLTQMMICTAMAHDGRHFDRDAFLDILAINPSVQDSDTGIFRHCSPCEKSLLARSGSNTGSQGPGEPVSARVLPVIMPFCMSPRDILGDTLSAVSCFTQEASTAAAAVIFNSSLKMVLNEDTMDMEDVACRVCSDITSRDNDISPRVFQHGINPENFMKYTVWYHDTIRSIMKLSIDESEKIICDRVNSLLKTPLTRATVDDPRCQLPYAVSILSRGNNDPRSIIITAASAGGGSSSLAAICGAMTGARHGEKAIPQALISGLVNRRRITEMCDLVVKAQAMKIGAIRFMQDEFRLTVKEKEELGALTRHMKKSDDGRHKTRAEKEMALSRHVVESWTKEDRARWKKEKRHKEDSGRND